MARKSIFKLLYIARVFACSGALLVFTNFADIIAIIEYISLLIKFRNVSIYVCNASVSILV